MNKLNLQNVVELFKEKGYCYFMGSSFENIYLQFSSGYNGRGKAADFAMCGDKCSITLFVEGIEQKHEVQNLEQIKKLI